MTRIDPIRVEAIALLGHEAELLVKVNLGLDSRGHSFGILAFSLPNITHCLSDEFFSRIQVGECVLEREVPMVEPVA